MSKERTIQIATYKGYEIQPAPDQLADSGEWEVKIFIVHHGGNETRERKFFTANSFKAWEEVVTHCFNFGTQIIDGKIENCTVDGL